MVLQSKLFKVAEVQISYNPKFKVSERPRIRSSNDAYRILIQQWNSGKIEFLEEFKIMLLNRTNSLKLKDIALTNKLKVDGAQNYYSSNY